MKFSIIIPIYNSEDYLEECILSVIQQNISFKDFIHLILVNDGSKDNSSKICIKFKNKYPDNINYIEIKNSGPAAARNIGIDNIPDDTTHVLFLDSDDKLDRDTIAKVKMFFEKNSGVSIAVLPVFYFENKSGPIKLNKRFNKGTRVINIFEEYTSPQFYIGGVVMKSSLLRDKSILFDENLTFWEDALFVNTLILIEGKYGVIHDAKYWYRKRINENSLVDISWTNKFRYIDLIQQGYQRLINTSIELYGKIIPYVQYLVIYHLKLFTFQRNSKKLLKVLNNHERKTFINTVRHLLNIFEEKYIIEQDTKNIHKEFMLYIRNGEKCLLEGTINDIDIGSAIKITKKRISKYKLILEGYFSDDKYLLKSSDKIFVQTFFNKRIYAKKKEIDKKISIWGIVVRDYRNSGFVIELPIWYYIFRFGLESKNGSILLMEFNLLKNLLNKVKAKL